MSTDDQGSAIGHVDPEVTKANAQRRAFLERQQAKAPTLRRATIEVTYDPHDVPAPWSIDWAYHLRMGDIDAESAFVVWEDEVCHLVVIDAWVARYYVFTNVPEIARPR